MYKIMMEFKSDCDNQEKHIVLDTFRNLFQQEEINCIRISEDGYTYISERTDNKLFGSYWAVLFKIKRNKCDVRKMFSSFEWICSSQNGNEVRENLLEDFF